MHLFFKRLTYYLVLLIFWSIIAFNCDQVLNSDDLINPDSKSLIDENERKWNIFSDSESGRFLSGRTIGNELFVSESRSAFSIDSTHNAISFNAIITSIYFYPSLSKDLYISTLDDFSHLILYPVQKFGFGNVIAKYIEIKGIKESYELQLPFLGQDNLVNNNQQFLAVVKNDSIPSSVVFLLFNYRIIENSQGEYYVKIDTMKSIYQPAALSESWQICSINAFDDNFFISINGPMIGYNYKINSNAQLFKINLNSERINQFLHNNDKYYSIASGIDGEKIFESDNNGIDWNYLSQIDPPTTSRLRQTEIYSFVADSLITVGLEEHQLQGNRLFSINMQTGESTELDNNGIEPRVITSISQFGDYVFLTTNNGLLFKKLDYFFDRKN